MKIRSGDGIYKKDREDKKLFESVCFSTSYLLYCTAVLKGA